MAQDHNSKKESLNLSAFHGTDKVFTGWQKSSFSGNNGSCVEVAQGTGQLEGFIGVRDSKNPAGAALVFTPNEWDCFLQSAKQGEFDNARND